MSDFQVTVKDLEEQQLNQMKEIQKEHAIQQSGGTAQQLRTMDQKTQTNKIKSNVGSSQTLNPKMTSTGMQAWRPQRESGGTQTEGAQYFDIAIDDKVADVNEQIETVIENISINKYQHLASRIRVEDVEKIIGKET